jgi:hypothetical protein
MQNHYIGTKLFDEEIIKLLHATPHLFDIIIALNIDLEPWFKYPQHMQKFLSIGTHYLLG